jgi:hypothetical protein
MCRSDAHKSFAGNLEEEEQSQFKLEGLFDENEESEKAVESIERKASLGALSAMAALMH